MRLPHGWTAPSAAATSVRRNRAVLLNALEYAVELKLIEQNPIRNLKWRAPKMSLEVDRRVVVNPRQARLLLEAVRAQHPSGPRLVAFFGVLYYSGLRPEEAIGLCRGDVALPDQEPADQERTSGTALGGAASQDGQTGRGQPMDRRRRRP